mgnify:CR=1 FL=1
MDRLAREYPSTRDGLSLTERRILPGYGRPIVGHDERIAVERKLRDRDDGLSKRGQELERPLDPVGGNR